MDIPLYERDCDRHFNLVWNELNFLRGLADKCTGCIRNWGFSVNDDDADRCSMDPCFTGVGCEEVGGAPYCGICPIGIDGDGRNCTVRNLCAKQPWVDCRMTDRFPYYRCGRCPSGYEGDGRSCKPADTCGKWPRFEGVDCKWSERAPHFVCGKCPPGHFVLNLFRANLVEKIM